MQRRQTARDWTLYSLVTVLVLLLLLIMHQIDRQWLKLAEMQTTLAEYAKDLRELRTAAISNGMRTPQASAAPTVAPAFKRAYAASRQPDYAQGDWSVNAFALNLKTITPLVSTDAYAAEVQSYILESLITRDPDTLEWEGLIAKDWRISPDGLTITFRLRDDVTFSDGTPLTADDVVFTFDFIMTEAIQAPRDRAYLEKIKSVTRTGAHEVVFTYKEPYFEALDLAGGMGILAKHFYEPYLQTPAQFNESKGLLFGSGPYRLADPKGWTPDQGNIELVRNGRYWGDVPPSYNRILWKIIQNDSARLTTYRNGEIDSYGARPNEYAGLKSDAQIMGKSQNFEYMPMAAGYRYIGWNQERNGKPTRFADRRVRQAMSYLTEVDRIVKDIYLNYAEPAVSPFGNASKQHDPGLQPYPFDLAKAKALLKEAGYQDRNGDGVLEDRDGKPFEFDLTYLESNEDTKRMVLLLKDLYARAGVRMNPRPQEWPVMLENLDKKDFEAITLGWTSGIETDIYQMFHGSQAKTNGDNFISYRNSELDKLIDQARATVDEAQRMPLWRQAERILHEDQPYTFLVRPQTLAFVDRRIRNLQLTKLGLNRGLLPLEEYVPATLQKYKQ
jgi:peptide/nickel transport system substrate-binding protein